MAITTTVDADALAARIGTSSGADVQRCLDVALELLDEQLQTAFRPVPADTLDELVLTVGQAVWDRRKSAQSGGQLQVGEGMPLPRSPRDPLTVAWPILSRYVVTGI